MTSNKPAGITVISIYYFLKSALAALGLVSILIILTLLPASPILKKFMSESISAAAAMTIAGLVAIIVGIVLLFFVLLYLVVAIGLLRLKKWARIMAIVLSAFEIYIIFPIGTIIGIMIIWYLLKDEIVGVFKD